MKFPDLPRSGFPVAQTIRQIITYLRSSRVVSINGVKGMESSNGTSFVIPVGEKNEGATNTLPPLWPRLKSPDEDEYTVSVTKGHVNERIPGNGDALESHDIKNILWGSDATGQNAEGDVKQTSITVGQQISIKVYVDVYGALGGTEAPEGFVAELVTEEEDVESIHYIPKCGDDRDGTEGIYHYKIAVLRAADADNPSPWLEMYLAGSHLDHFRDLPQIDNFLTETREDHGRPVSKYDADVNTYQFRATKARYGTIITEEEQKFSLDFFGENVGGGSEVLIEPDVEPEEPLPDAAVQFRTIRELGSSEDAGTAGPQVRVSTADAVGGGVGTGETILIRGNGNNKALIIEDDAASPTELGRVSWRDGLMAEADDVTINLKVLPDGTVGQMLYHDGTRWVVLAAPTGSGTSVLGHDGTAPVWLDTSECE